MTPKGEIEMLQSLSQRGVAFLLGVTPRSVRNYADLPRNDDGSYDAREVVAFVRSKLRPIAPPIPDWALAGLLGGRSITDGALVTRS
jgi:hypothetical protein